MLNAGRECTLTWARIRRWKLSGAIKDVVPEGTGYAVLRRSHRGRHSCYERLIDANAVYYTGAGIRDSGTRTYYPFVRVVICAGIRKRATTDAVRSGGRGARTGRPESVKQAN